MGDVFTSQASVCIVEQSGKGYQLLNYPISSRQIWLDDIIF
jgi:hypothetical protein